MKCREVQQKLDAYLDGALAPRAIGRIEAHLQSCPTCCQQFERIRGLADALRLAPIPPVPDGFAARVVTAARQRMATSRPRSDTRWSPVRWWLELPLSVRAAAAVALVIGLTLGGLMGGEMWPRPGSGSAATAQSVVLATPGAGAAPAEADPVTTYRLDHLTEAEKGSLTEALLTAVSARERRGY